MNAARPPSPVEIVAAGRLGDVLEAVDLHGHPLPRIRRDRSLPDRLRIVYLVARVGVGEGERLLLAQARELAALGADVTVLVRAHPDDADEGPGERRIGTRARMRRVPYGEAMAEAVPPCDLIVAGSWEFVVPARLLGLAPVVLFEQGELEGLGDVPDGIHEVVAGALRSASVTFAVGERAPGELRASYGVVARSAPGVVDLGTFRPATGRAAPPAEQRDGLVYSGSDLLAWDRVDDARKVVARAGTSHGQRALWVDPQAGPVGCRRGVEPFAERIAAPAREDLAQLLRRARVFLSTAARTGFATAPLEAMAAGATVVSSAHPGVLAYAEHGRNALLAPVGDVEGLADAVRRVLDDPELASRLARAGLETARAFGWQVVGPRLLEQFRDVVATVAPAPPVSGYAVRLGGLRFVRPGDAARLRARLGACTTRDVALPVSQPAYDGYRVVRWRVVARRDGAGAGTTRVYLPARSERPLADAPHQEGIDLLRAGRAEEALERFVTRCEKGSSAEQVVLGRWIVLAMLGAGRPSAAAELAAAFATDYPTHPDYVVLGVRCALAARRPTDVSGPMARVRLLGVGARHDEWFDEPHRLLAGELGASA
ncbi:MAG TPA: glycosyltransferase family 4 protein [Acidimicrobiales bacterium]|nr:glycosyltransferase family 4 protein [Acidimicrobiales bacterium]